jgi:HTH-type transcriptional regulator/antitoxin HigA
MGALRVDLQAYGRLLARSTPKVIESEADYDRSLAAVERLMDRGDRRTPEEEALLSLIVTLIQAYEEKRYPMRKPSPCEMLVYLLEQKGLKQADLIPVLKSSGYISDVVNGKRAISKNHARKLADFFGVSAELFI